MATFKKIVITVLLLYVYEKSFSQSCNGIFSGNVLDENNQALPGAAIRIEPGNFTLVTNTNGYFNFNKLCNTHYVVTIQYVGYKALTLAITPGAWVEKIIHLEPDVKNLNEVIVQDKIDGVEHAQNFAQLSQQDRAATAGKTLGESLKEIPGVNTIQSGPGIFKPVIHGVHSQRILILNHGVRQEGQQWGAEHAPEIDPFIASSIVVIKDASSIKYGTDALGGVIVINPAPLPERSGLGGTINSVFQSNGRPGVISGMVEGGIKHHDGWGWRVQGTAKRNGDFHTPGYNLTNTGATELNFSASTGYHARHSGFEIFFSHFQTTLGLLRATSVGNVQDLENAMEREPPQYTASFSYKIRSPHQEVTHNLLKLNAHLKTGKGMLRFQYGFQNNARKEFDVRIGDYSTLPINDLVLNTHTVETEWEIAKQEKRTLCLGVTGMFQNNKNIYGTYRIPFIPNFTNASAGIFAITKWTIKNWTIDVGTRYDYRDYSVKGFDFKNTLYTSNLDFQNVSATAGGTVKVKKSSSLSLNLSSAWRPPHVSELYSQGKHISAGAFEYGLLINDSTTQVMNIHAVNFKSERALKVVGSYQMQGNVLNLEVSTFANYIFNYIYLKPLGISRGISGYGPAFHYAQTDALFLGLDFSARFKVNSSLNITPKVSFIQASDKRNHDYLISIPSNRYETDIRYGIPNIYFMKDFYVETRLKFIAKQYRAPRTITPRQFLNSVEEGVDPLQGNSSNFDFMDAPAGYFLLNASTGFSIKRVKSRYDFRLGVENILNTVYREYTNRFRYYANDSGRNFSISINYVF